jgi:hypothetical protein
MLLYPASPVQIKEIIVSAVLLEQEFTREALKNDILGLNHRLMAQYIEFVGDRLLDALDQLKYFHTPNPLDWMDKMSLQGKTNFFERRVGEYAKAGISTTQKKILHKFVGNMGVSDDVTDDVTSTPLTYAQAISAKRTKGTQPTAMSVPAATRSTRLASLKRKKNESP